MRDEMGDEFDPWEFCWEMLDDSVRCDETGCWTTDDVLNAMCSEVWEKIVQEMGFDLDFEDDEEYGW